MIANFKKIVLQNNVESAQRYCFGKVQSRAQT